MQQLSAQEEEACDSTQLSSESIEWGWVYWNSLY